jgi:membrane fusion protein (multidrug efflux system)
MTSPSPAIPRRALTSAILIGAVIVTGVLLAAWKRSAGRAAAAAAANQPEPVELVVLATAQPRKHTQATTAVGTIHALRSVTLRNEVAGTVRQVSLTPGAIVQQGAVLVALDVSVEQAELQALEARARLTETTLGRLERLRANEATSQEVVDQARAARDVAVADVARLRAVIARKVIRAPFRARVGIADVHPGQYLNEGTELTTLQGVDDATNVDFAVAQRVAAQLRPGSAVDVIVAEGVPPLSARIVAVDARVDSTTRNATVRARLTSRKNPPSPGASVRVLVPVGDAETAVSVPVSALRSGPEGDHVWVVTADSGGATRAHQRTVKRGSVLGDEVIILEGITAGEQVAASGSFKLREGLRVQPAAEATAAGAR